MKPMRQGTLALVAVAVLVAAVGCDLTNSERRKTETATTTDIAAMRQDISRLQQDVEAFEAELKRSGDENQAELAEIKRALSQLETQSTDLVAAAKKELADKINEIEEKRIADKNALNTKMDWIVAQLAKIAGTTGGPPGGNASGGTRTEQGIEYIVKEGDTVWKIAAAHRDRYGATVEDILKANGLDANSTIRPGDKLFIPLKK